MHMRRCPRRARLRLPWPIPAAVLRTSTLLRMVVVRRPVLPAAGLRSTRVTNESPALAPGFLLVRTRFPAHRI